MRIFICEKPSQARDIAAVLGAGRKAPGYLAGDGVAVTWCFGHLFETAPPEAYDEAHKRWRLETLPIVPVAWKHELKRESTKQFRVIQSLLRDASEVVIATDADREGETIGREVLEACAWRGSVRRLWLSALDEASIRKALARILPGEATAPLYQAGLGRARADWLIGMNLTRVYTLIGQASGIDGVLSVGRVQTPTLRLVVERDREIERFVANDYWEVVATVQPPASTETFGMRWKPRAEVSDAEGRCINAVAARELAQRLAGAVGRITAAQTLRKTEPAPLPYCLSTLQQDCSQRFSMSAQETLDCAQRLYEQYKATTYPRTDCEYLPMEQLAAAKDVINALRQSGLDAGLLAVIANAQRSLQSRAWNDAKITAHHAIIPTLSKTSVSSMDETDRRVYELVVRRYLAQFYPDHEYDQTYLEARFGEEVFVATGRTVVVSGWKAVTQILSETEAEERDALKLPRVAIGNALTCRAAATQAKQTQPPARYTDASLLQAMKSVGRLVQDDRLKKILRETSGIGTEATRASIIETLGLRQYVERQKRKFLVSTSKGRLLIDILPAPITDPATTAVWEQALEEIAAGRAALAPFIARQSHWLRQLVEIAKREGQQRLQASSELRQLGLVVHPCPSCGNALRRRRSTTGFFWGCAGYPDCKTTLPDVEGRPNPSSMTARRRAGSAPT